MRPHSALLLSSSILLISLIALGQTAPTTPATKSPGTAILAVVSLQQIYDGLDEKRDADRDLESLRQTLTKDLDARKAEIEKLSATLDHPPFKADSPELLKLQDDLLDKSAALQTATQVDQQKLSLEARRRVLLIHRHINDTIAAYAQSANIAVVLITDEPDPTTARTGQDLQIMMVARKIAYVQPPYDITRTLKERMNTSYNPNPRQR
jgi:Skp family chaperone for outer membrane proteins